MPTRVVVAPEPGVCIHLTQSAIFRVANRDVGHGMRRRRVECSSLSQRPFLGKEDFAEMSHESGPRTVLNWVLPGLIAGIVFAMWAMLVGIVTSTLWAAPQGIAQSIGIGSPGHSFQLVPFVAGVIGHMMNSIVLGVVFVAIARAIRLHGPAAVVGGMVYGVIVYFGMFWILLRGVLRSTSASFLSANPEWSWIAAHLMFGVVLGALAAYGPLRTLHAQAARPASAV